MTKEQLLRKLEGMISEEGSQLALAKKLDVNPSYLSEVMRGIRQPSEKFLRAMGLVKRTVFERAEA